MKWRIIITDSEQPTGVAPECSAMTSPLSAMSLHWVDGKINTYGVWDCCPHPHLECWTPVRAQALAAMLNDSEVQVCE